MMDFKTAKRILQTRLPNGDGATDRVFSRTELSRNEGLGARRRSEETMETWYLLFDGSSADGRGQGRYIGRTTDKEAARKHYMKCAKDPYSTGRVDIVTDTKIERAWSGTDWERACRGVQRRARWTFE